MCEGISHQLSTPFRKYDLVFWSNPSFTVGAPIRDGMRRPVPQGRGCFRIPIDALDEVQKETGL